MNESIDIKVNELCTLKIGKFNQWLTECFTILHPCKDILDSQYAEEFDSLYNILRQGDTTYITYKDDLVEGVSLSYVAMFSYTVKLEDYIITIEIESSLPEIEEEVVKKTTVYFNG